MDPTEILSSGSSYVRTNPIYAILSLALGCALITGIGVAFLRAPSHLRPLLLVVLTTIGGGVAWVVWNADSIIATFRRSRAIGAAPSLVAYSILQLQLTPTMEIAADFAAEQVGGLLGRSVRRHRLAEPTGERALEAFAEEWREHDRSLERAVSLMGAAIDSPENTRDRILERALDTALTGARERVSTFATEIRGPAMGIYAFGVMLPLSLVGMLPVVATTSGGVSIALLAGFYDLLLPIALIGGSAWLALKRPSVAAPSFDVEHLEARTPLWQVAGAGLGIAALAYVGVPFVLPQWSAVIVAVGTGLGSILVLSLSPLRAQQEALDSVESGLPDALSVAGQRLAEGAAIESAVSAVGTRLTGPVADLFGRAAQIRTRLGVDVQTAFRGNPGALEDRSSERIETAISLLLAAGEQGPAGGDTLLRLGAYFDTLDEVERDARRDLAQTTNTLGQTALVFAPAIAGVTVALATGMDGVNTPGSTIDVSLLGTVIGIYVLLLASILPSLSVALKRGFAPIRMGYQAGIALATGSVLYPVTFLAARTLVYV